MNLDYNHFNFPKPIIMDKVKKLIPIDSFHTMWIKEFHNRGVDYSSPDQAIKGLDFYLFMKKELLSKFQVHYQILNSSFLISEEQIMLAVNKVIKAYETQSNISNEEAIELMLYLAGERQISQAINLLGVKFPESLRDEIRFTEVIFGPRNQVAQAVAYFQENYPNIKHHPFFPINPKYFSLIIKNFNIDHKLILNLANTNRILKDNQDLFENISDIPHSELRKYLIESLNQKMVDLFMDNYKG